MSSPTVGLLAERWSSPFPKSWDSKFCGQWTNPLSRPPVTSINYLLLLSNCSQRNEGWVDLSVN